MSKLERLKKAVVDTSASSDAASYDTAASFDAAFEAAYDAEDSAFDAAWDAEDVAAWDAGVKAKLELARYLKEQDND